MTFGDRQPGIDCLDDPPHGVDQQLGFPDVRMFSTASVIGVVTDALYRSLREPGQPTLFSPPMKNPFDRNFTADAGGIWA